MALTYGQPNQWPPYYVCASQMFDLQVCRLSHKYYNFTLMSSTYDII